MDVLRSCYDCEMRFPGIPDPVPVRWYFTDQPFMPLRHRFASRVWLSDKRLPAPIGEQPSPRVYYNGRGPGILPCAGPQGSADAWQGLTGTPLFLVAGYPGRFAADWQRARRFIVTHTTPNYKQVLWRNGTKWIVDVHFSPHYGTRWRRGREWFAIAQTESMHVAFWERARTWAATEATSSSYAAAWSRARTWAATEATSSSYAAAWSRARTWAATEATSSSYAAAWERARDWMAIKETNDNVVTFDCGSLTATGTTQGTAAAIATDFSIVTSSANNQGVILPAGCYRIIVWNNNTVVSGFVVKVYPPSGAQIGTAGTNNPVSINPNTRLMFVEASSTQWWTVAVS